MKNLYKLSKYKDYIVCPSSIYVPYFLKEGFEVGLQNVSEYGMGAYTGEISVTQATSIGIKYVIIGHSERRKYFNESSKVINRKLRKAVSNNLKAILCIGESLDDKNNNKTFEVIKNLIDLELKDVEFEYYENVIIAYEPLWAIGTGVVPSNEDIEKITSYIKDYIMKKYNFMPIVLYGGSTNEKNISELNELKNIDGFLIGGASLIPEKIIKILETIK